MGDLGIDPGFWSGRRVLVTGNTGFKGAWLSLWLLALGADVVGLSDEVPTDPALHELVGNEDNIDQFWVDVRDREAVVQAIASAAPEVVFHLAAQPFVRRSFGEPAATYETNVMGTVNVLDAVRAAPGGVRAVVAVTSDKCYENREWEWPYRENEPMGGHDPYSSSKGAAEIVIASYRSSFFGDPDGPRVASARAGNVIGGGDWGEDRLIPDVMRSGLAGQPVAIRRPNAVRPWQHVLNPLHGYLLLAEGLYSGPAHATAYNFGPDPADVLPVADVVELLAAAWGEPLEVVADEGEHPHEAGLLSLDSSRARVRLGWRPQWDLNEGLAATAEWYRAFRDGEPGLDLTLGQIKRYSAPADAQTG